MKCAITIQRQVEAVVTVECPDTWDEAQVREAVTVRMEDVTRAACMWGPSATNRTLIVGVELDAEAPESEGMDMYGPEMEDPVLTDDDLIGG